MSTDGYIRYHAPSKPLNDNPRAYDTDVENIKGAPQPFASIDDLVSFHPNRMKIGMTMLIINYPNAGNLSEYFLSVDPSALVDGNGDSIITAQNFSDYFQLKDQKDSVSTRVFNYAPNKSGGGKPSFPYTSSTEATDGWTPVYDVSKGHKWIRWRTDDVDANSDGVYDNWTVPISLGQSFTSGDYIENRFIRQDVDLTERTSSSGLEVDKYYIVKSGTVTVNGVAFTQGKYFLHEAGNSYSFSSATVQETLPAPAFTKADGTLNNEPEGYSDTPPVGSAMLWVIEAQKSVYGQLKSEWRIKRLVESPQYVRYSDSPTPLPSTICGVNDSAASGTTKDTALIAAGWVSAYNNQSYIALREDDNGGSTGPPFTVWRVEKINEESGEYTENVFKLYDHNLQPGDVAVVKPTQANAIEEGFFDTPQAETSNKINWIFSARKFFNGELKGEWSDGIPYTGKTTYDAVIASDSDDNFKSDPNAGTIVPSTITLEAQLYKGIEKLWEKSDITLSFVWKRVYDDGSADDTTADTDTGDDFYILASTGTFGNAGYKWSGQRLVVKPEGVTGKAVFQVTITVTMDEGDDLVFTELFDILDITDGKNSKDLVVRADNQRTIYDTVNTVFVPNTIRLNAFQSNLVSPTFYWYQWTGAAWAAISTGGAYTVSGSQLTIDASALFTADGSAEEQRIAVSTHATNPDSADFTTTFSDFITIVKLSSAGVGAPGENAAIALLDNETATLILNSVTGAPIAGETGSSGRIVTILQVWEGNTKKIFGGGNDYTVAVSPDSGDIQFAVQANGNDALIYISQWNSTTARSAVCTVTITYGAKTLPKRFQISTTEAAPGAILLDMDTDKGYQFTPSDKTDKTLTANLYDSEQDPQLQTSGYEYRWNVAGVWSSWSTTRTRTLTRANVVISAVVTLEARPVGESSAIRSVSKNFSDIVDAQNIIMQTDATSATSANKLPTSKKDSATAIVSGVTWRSINDSYWDTNLPTYDCVGYENPSDISQFIWSNPRRIKGETGDQGNSGDFYFDMYKVDGTTLPNGTGSTLAQMTSDGWKSPEERPTSGDIYSTNRRWDGEGVVFTNGYPDTSPASGSAWSTPVKISGDDGDQGPPGDEGEQGEKGWAPSLAVVSDGERRVHRLVNWIGGEGTKPGNIGDYLASSGFTSNIASATDIRGSEGPTGPTGADGGTSRWSKRNVVSPTDITFLNDIDKGSTGSMDITATVTIVVRDPGGSGYVITLHISNTPIGGANPSGSSQQIWSAKVKGELEDGDEYLTTHFVLGTQSFRYFHVKIVQDEGRDEIVRVQATLEKTTYQ